MTMIVFSKHNIDSESDQSLVYDKHALKLKVETKLSAYNT